jgi:hypothetical protein
MTHAAIRKQRLGSMRLFTWNLTYAPMKYNVTNHSSPLPPSEFHVVANGIMLGHTENDISNITSRKLNCRLVIRLAMMLRKGEKK